MIRPLLSLLLLLWALPAAAGQWREPQPYLLPQLDVTLINVGGQSTAQASVGLLGGLRMRYAGKPNVLSNTRASAVGTYGLTTGSLGGDFRVGSFVGPQGRYLLYQIGPDVWFNGYGQQGALDYWMPWSPGVDLKNQLVFTPIREISLVGEVTPGWAFVAARQGGGVGPFHELTLTALAVIRASAIRLTVGYTRQYRSFGVVNGLILSGGF
ncbi:MAG: hypothetical protein R3F59_02695 [Myxococcota bacterium]